MLNELFNLAKILDDSGIEQKEWHKNLIELKKANKNNPCYRIWISKDCSIKGIEILNEDLVSILRKYETSNGQSFPAFNCPQLWIFNKKDKKEKDKKEGDIITDWTKENNDEFCMSQFNEWITDTRQNEFFEQNKKLKKDNKDDFKIFLNKVKTKIDVCAKEMPKKLVEFIPRDSENSVSKLIEIVLKNNFNFQDLLKQFVLEQLEKKENYKFILEFLLKDNISIVLDYKEWQELNSVSRYPVAHEKTVEFINNILQENEKRNNQNTKKTDENKMRKDAFGDDSDIIKDKLPKVRTYLGDVSLRSMTRESLCHTRYGNIESESYPISKSNIANIKKAIEWLSSNERKGKNWTPANSKELLFVYPSKICDIKLADMFGGRNDEDSNESSENIATFEKKAEDVVKALTKLSTNGNPIDIKLFAIKKIDDGHKNISYYRNYEAQKLIKSAEDWKNGCKNIPNMPFETKMPFPLDIAKIVNKLYKMDGTENEGSKKLKPTSSYQGLNLMLEENNSELSRYLLSILRDNYCGLIKYLGCSYNNRRKNDLKFDKNFRYIYIYPTIGLFLYKLQINKERYMESFPFLLGQMLKISDELHALWCEVVRKGNLPPQLAGNSLFSASLETPMSILVQLGQRINPYLAWAKQYRTKKEEKSGLATWYIRLYEENCNKLQQVLPNKSIIFNDVEKSQLFVGYLASFPKKQGDNNE